MASLSRLQSLANSQCRLLASDGTEKLLFTYPLTYKKRTASTKSSKKKKDHYDILGLDRQAEVKEVKNAFYKLSKQYHPDVNKEAGAVEKFQELTDAYEVLSSPDSRAAYDRQTQMQASAIVVTQKSSSTMRTSEDYTQFFKERREKRKAHDAKKSTFKPRQPPQTNVRASGNFKYEEEMTEKERKDWTSHNFEELPRNITQQNIGKGKVRNESGFIMLSLLVLSFLAVALYGQQAYEPKGLAKERKRVAQQLASSNNSSS